MLNNQVLMSPESIFYDYHRKMEKQLCQVCQNLAIGFHYGAYVCEACKKFFKRYLLNHNANSVTCKEECDVNSIGGRKCSDCRYKKCLRLGMKLSNICNGKQKFDISKIPCRICGTKSSGFHFGSLTCEGCKGFFRRADLIKDRLVCHGNGTCIINFNNRSMCKCCRYQQCLKAGMSKSGSRIGRQPNAVKHHCLLEVENSKMQVAAAHSANTYFASELSLMGSYNDESGSFSLKIEPTTSSESVASTIMSNLQEREINTFYTRIKEAIAILQMPFSKAMYLLHIVHSPLRTDQTLLEVWTTMMQHFDVHSHMLIQFAKKIPIFNELSLVDRKALVQESMYPIILLSLARSYTCIEERFNYFDFTEQEYQVILCHFPAIERIMGHVINVSRIVHKLGLSSHQIGLFCVMELFKNNQNLESAYSVQVYYHRTLSLCWASVVDQLVESDSVYKQDILDLDISSSLQTLNCPSDLLDMVADKFSRLCDLKSSLQRLRILFVYFSDWLKKYNIEHQTIIDQLKVKHPELPFTELYVEMFQLTASSESLVQ